MSYRGLKATFGLILALSCGAAGAITGPSLIVVREPLMRIPWGMVSSLAFSPDGKYLAVTGKPQQWFGSDARKAGSIACWRVADWKRVRTTPQLDAFYCNDTHARKLAWTPDSTMLVIYDTRLVRQEPRHYFIHRCSVWSRDGWRLLSTAKVSAECMELAVSPDGGSYVSPTASGSGLNPDEFNVWDLRTGSLRYSVKINVDPTEKSRHPDAGQDSATYSSDGKLLAVSYGDVVCLINVATRAVISWRRMPDRVHFVRFQPNTQQLLAVYADSYQHLATPDLTPISAPVTGNFGRVGGVQFALTGRWFVVESGYRTDDPSGKGGDDLFDNCSAFVTLVETASMKVFGIIGRVKYLGTCLTLSPDGSTVVLAVAGTKHITGDDSSLLVFPTSKPGGPSPDEWLKAHPGTAKAVAAHPTLPHNTPSGTSAH